ncbi:MAG: hypothetical protein M1365_11700 [Actinobacteria bacterium]|nr:hypothetical protein [Actinomycetota bacterium]
MEIKIKIKIKDDLAYAEVAYILDQDGLLEDIHEIRKCWGLNKNLVPYDEFDSWRQFPHDLPLSSKATSLLYEAKDNLEDDLPKTKEIAYLNTVEFEIEQLLRKQGISPSFNDLILRALACDEIRDKDWDNVELTKKDFKYGKWIYEASNVFFPLERFYNRDTKQEIRRDREWYWLHKRGKSYREIARETKQRGHIEVDRFRDNVKRQIGRYKDFLKGEHLESK